MNTPPQPHPRQDTGSPADSPSANDNFRTLAGNRQQGFCIIDMLFDQTGQPLDYRFLEVNPAFEQLTGLVDVVGKTMRALQPAHEQHWFDIYAQVVRTRQPLHVEKQAAHLAGGVWYEVFAFPFGLLESHQVAILFNDTTERQGQEQRQAFLLTLSDSLRILRDPAGILQASMHLLGEHLGLSRAYYFHLESDQQGWVQTIEAAYQREPDQPNLVGRLSLQPFGNGLYDGLDQGNVVNVSDVAALLELTPEQRAIYQKIGVAAFLNLPLLRDGTYSSGIAVHSPVPRDWLLAEVALIREVAMRTWDAVERARAEEALRMNQLRTRIQKEAFQSAINGEPLASSLNTLTQMVKPQLGSQVRTVFYLAYPDGASLYAIEGAGDMPQSYTGRVDGFPIGEASFCSGLAIATGRPVLTRDVFEDPLWEPYRPLAAAHSFRACSSYPILTRDGKAVGSFALYFTDVHQATTPEFALAEAVTQAAAIILSRHTEALERASADEALRESETRLARELADTQQLQSISSRLIEANEMEGLYQQIMEAAKAIMHADTVSMQRFFPEQQALHLLAWQGFHPESARYWEWVDVRSVSTCGMALRKGKRVVVADVETEASLQNTGDLEAFRRSGLRAVQTTPLISRSGQVVGMLSSHWKTVHTPTDRELGLLDVIARQAADSVERHQASEALGQSEERFRTLVQNLPDYAIFRLDTAGIITEWTEGAQRVKGYTAQEAIGQHLSLFYTPQAIAAGEVEAELAQAARTGRTEREGLRIHKNGTRFFVNEIATAIYDGQGELSGFTKISRDITDRKSEQEQLRHLEERTRIAVEAARMGTWEWHLLTNEVYWNEQHFELFGMQPKPQPLNPDTFSRHVHPDDRGWVLDELNRAIRERTPYEAEFRALREDTGQTIWMSGYGRITDEVDGRASRMNGVMLEVTQRRQAEDEIRHSQQRLQIILDSIADHAILTFDPDTILTSWNTGAEQLFNYSAGEAIGQSVQIIFTPEDRATGELAKEMQRARREGQTPDERDHLRKDGSRLYISGVLSPLYDADGQLLGYVKVARDLSERRGMEQALRETDRRKDEFLAMLAHELRNPMSTIRSGLKILTLTVGDEPTTGPSVGNATIAMMKRQTDQLVRLVDDLLDVSRINQGKIELHRQRVDLSELVSQATESVRALYGEQGRHLQVDLPTAPIHVAGDATRLTQVVTNLLTNGARYTGEGGQVWVSLAQRNGPTGRQEALLEVRDNGMGIAPDQLKAIFDLFVQVDNSPARSKGGLGLGLTLVKRLVDLHGGRVEAQSEGVGKGSTFHVHLPTLETAPALASTPVERATTQTTSQRILVIDDNVDAGLTLSMLLKLEGYEAHTRTSGRAGIKAAEALQPAAILLDIGMPDLDGYETCRLIREQPWGKAIVVVALSGYGQQEDRQQTQATGFDGHLVKPVDLDALTGLLSNLSGKGATSTGAD